MKNRKTQWHPAFCSAVRLELRADKQKLQYTNEYNLNAKPIQIDLLQELVFDIRALTEKDDKEYADSVFDVSLKENRHLFEALRKEGTTGMCEALVELMRPELDAAVKKAREEASEEARAEERANTERERANTERERQRAVAAEEEVQRLREELRRMQQAND